jgi:hypothetical protein
MDQKESKEQVENNKSIIDLYLDSLSPRERRAYEIARDHLGSAFSLVKSVGFVRFLDKNKREK